MTAKTTKEAADAAREHDPDGEADEVEAVASEQDEAVEDEAVEEASGQDAASAAEEEAEQPAAAKPKRKRRVRVIEVIDDEDLDDVLEAIDAEDDEEEPPAAPAKPARPAAKPAAKTLAKPAAKPAAKAAPRPERLEPPEEEPAAARPVRKVGPFAYAPTRPPKDGGGQRSLVGIVTAVVLVALLASLAIWQWTRASGLASEKDERAAVAKVALQYGDVALNYNASNYQEQAKKAEKLMAGDLLDSFKKQTLPALSGGFQNDAKVAMTSKGTDAYVGSVNGKFATAVVMADISIQTKDGKVNQPSTLIRLAMAKVDGKWKVTKQYPSGVNDDTRTSGSGLVPSGGASPTPSASTTGKPKN